MKKIIKLLMLLLFIVSAQLQAQEALPATGGDAGGDGGSASYTVGQVIYTTVTGADGTVSQGIQQPYEIEVVTGIPEASGIGLSVMAYPNPATNYLMVKVKDYEISGLQYYVYSINGKLLQVVKASGEETRIEINNLTSGTYFIKIIDDKQEIKTFKIIKK